MVLLGGVELLSRFSRSCSIDFRKDLSLIVRQPVLLLVHGSKKVPQMILDSVTLPSRLGHSQRDLLNQ